MTQPLFLILPNAPPIAPYTFFLNFVPWELCTCIENVFILYTPISLPVSPTPTLSHPPFNLGTSFHRPLSPVSQCCPCVHELGSIHCHISILTGNTPLKKIHSPYPKLLHLEVGLLYLCWNVEWLGVV